MDRKKCHYSGISRSYAHSPWAPQQPFQKAAFNWRSRQLNRLGGFLVTSAKEPAQDETQTRPPRAVKISTGHGSKLLLSLMLQQNMIFSPPWLSSHQLNSRRGRETPGSGPDSTGVLTLAPHAGSSDRPPLPSPQCSMFTLASRLHVTARAEVTPWA